MNLSHSFTDTHRLLLPLAPPPDLPELRARMRQASLFGKVFAEINFHTRSLDENARNLRAQIARGSWSDTSVAGRDCDSTAAVSVYGSSLQHELTSLALVENDVWQWFQDGLWYAIGEPDDDQIRGAIRAARTAASLMHQGADVYLPSVAEDVYDCIDLYAVLEVEGVTRGWAIQVIGGHEERVTHLVRKPNPKSREEWRLWRGCVNAQERYGVPWIPTFVRVADTARSRTDAA